MKDNKAGFIIVIIILVILLFFIFFINFNTRSSKNNDDAIAFKKEYELLNNSEDSFKHKYINLDIEKNNPIKYSNYNEIIELIKNGTGVVLFGYPECHMCRSVIPVLFDVVKNNKIDRIYYLNIKDDRDSYTLIDGELSYDLDLEGNEIKGSEDYFKLVNLLDEYLSEYVILYNGKEYKTGNKRIYTPTVLFVKDGNIVGFHVATVEGHINEYDNLTEDQIEELYDIYEEYIIKMNNNACSLESSC